MEYAFSEMKTKELFEIIGVLILVLVEYAFSVNINAVWHNASTVLILVLVEYAFSAQNVILSGVLGGLNPCFSGICF